MDYRIKSYLLIFGLVAAAVVVGLLASNEGITGAAVTNGIACYDHIDCNDNIKATEDICKNPGTINSLCVNKPKTG